MKESFVLRFTDPMSYRPISEVVFSTHKKAESYVDTYLFLNGIKHYTITPETQNFEVEA
tara:strand:+ start:2475 stop:2651 length:177 start_codon:yes stop_codon:yes gene_type:complete